jgi:hypothetical protein
MKIKESWTLAVEHARRKSFGLVGLSNMENGRNGESEIAVSMKM